MAADVLDNLGLTGVDLVVAGGPHQRSDSSQGRVTWAPNLGGRTAATSTSVSLLVCSSSTGASDELPGWNVPMTLVDFGIGGGTGTDRRLLPVPLSASCHIGKRRLPLQAQRPRKRLALRNRGGDPIGDPLHM